MLQHESGRIIFASQINTEMQFGLMFVCRQKMSCNPNWIKYTKCCSREHIMCGHFQYN